MRSANRGGLEESFFERQKHALDQIAHSVERFHNRFLFESASPSERYLEGRLTIILKLRDRRSGEELALFVYAEGAGLGDIPFGEEVLPVAVAEDQYFPEEDPKAEHLRALGSVCGCKSRMLVASVKIVDGPQEIVAPLVWLERTDHVYG